MIQKRAFIALPGRGGHSGLMLLRLFNHPGAGSEEFYSVQGAGHDQFIDNSLIGWRQGGVSSFSNLLVSTSLGSVFLWSAVFIWRGSAAATAAKLLQSCPTLCDPIDGSPPGSPVPGILQARTLEWVAIPFSNA